MACEGRLAEQNEETYVLLCKKVFHLLLPCLAERVGLEGSETVVDGQVDLSDSERGVESHTTASAADDALQTELMEKLTEIIYDLNQLWKKKYIVLDVCTDRGCGIVTVMTVNYFFPHKYLF